MLTARRHAFRVPAVLSISSRRAAKVSLQKRSKLRQLQDKKFGTHWNFNSLLLLSAAIAVMPEELKTILTAIAVIAVALLAAFFVYSVLVMALYWVVLLLPLLCFGAGAFLWFQDQMVGNIVMGASVALGVLWILLVKSKRANVLRRVLNSLNRSLP